VSGHVFSVNIGLDLQYQRDREWSRDRPTTWARLWKRVSLGRFYLVGWDQLIRGPASVDGRLCRSESLNLPMDGTAHGRSPAAAV
jgi:hypothetical protein